MEVMVIYIVFIGFLEAEKFFFGHKVTKETEQTGRTKRQADREKILNCYFLLFYSNSILLVFLGSNSSTYFSF